MKTATVGAFEAKTHFSELLEKVREGMVFVVTKHGRPVAQLGPTEARGVRPAFGSARGRVHLEPGFDEPLADLAEYER
jgi:prevent-host-death family protein